MNPEVVFIYGVGNHDPCHAVVRNVTGHWSNNRVGFCGTEPQIGPMPWVEQPQGGLCHRCREHIEQGADGVWRSKAWHGDPLAERLARLLYEEETGKPWDLLPPPTQASKRRAARVALDQWPVHRAQFASNEGDDD